MTKGKPVSEPLTPMQEPILVRFNRIGARYRMSGKHLDRVLDIAFRCWLTCSNTAVTDFLRASNALG